VLTRAGTAGVVAVTALALAWMASGLPATTFYSGDSGLKLISALEAIEHPGRPFELELPRIGRQAVPFVDPMVVVHGGHAHSLQSPLFPPLSAPLIAAFGVRGAYLLPALAFVALVPLLASARRYLVPDASWGVLAWIVVAANPLLLYALEFWEHAPAVALLAAGTAVVAPSFVRDLAATRMAAGGALVGAGVLLRPEGAWYAAGLALALGPRWWLAFGAGAAALLLPAAVVNYAHFGTPLGAHASAVLAPLGSALWFATRWQRVLDWLWPAAAADAIGLTLVAAACVAAFFTVDVRVRQALALAGTAVIAVLAARRALPTQSFWQGFPLALLALMPSSAWAPAAKRLALAALVAVAGVVLTATNDGGAQWGTRFLLIAAPPLLLLAARSATDAAGTGAWRPARLALVAVIFLAAAAASRSAYLELRGTKRNYQSLVTATQTFTRPGEVILTNLWWLDQVNATLHGTRTFLYAADSAAASRALATLRAERLDAVTLAWSADAAESPFPLESALAGTCFRISTVRAAELRSIRFAAARCAVE